MAASLAFYAGGFDLPTALQWGAALAKALAEVHAMGVVVGALTPHNVLVTELYEPILAGIDLCWSQIGPTGQLTAGRPSGADGGACGTSGQADGDQPHIVEVSTRWQDM